MSNLADSINAVYDVLAAEAVPSGDLSYVQAVLFGDADRDVSGISCYLLVRTGEPAVIDTTWKTTTNRLGQEFVIMVRCIIDVPDSERPYGVTGDSTKRGPLVLADDVMNVLDANRSTILDANAGTVDMICRLVGCTCVGGKSYEAQVEVTIKGRFTAGQR